MGIIEVNGTLFKEIGLQTRPQKSGIEFDMVKKFIEYRKYSFEESSNRHLAIFIEPKINNAYPDIIFAEYNPHFFEKWNNYRNNLSLIDLKVLNCIYEKGVASSGDIVKALGIKYKSLLNALESLFDAKLIDRKYGNWIITNKNFIGIHKIESVEAKINKWGVVLQQALLNKNFSSESSILIKLKNEPKDDIFTMLSEFGLGLYVFNEKEFYKAKEPILSGLPNNHNALYINEWIGRILYYMEASNEYPTDRKSFS